MSTTLTDRAVTRVRDGQQVAVDAVSAVVKRVEKVVPSGPSLSLPKSVPTTQKIIDDAFSFSLKLIEAQREFAADLLNAVSPVLKKATGQSAAKPKAPAKTA